MSNNLPTVGDGAFAVHCPRINYNSQAFFILSQHKKYGSEEFTSFQKNSFVVHSMHRDAFFEREATTCNLWTLSKKSTKLAWIPPVTRIKVACWPFEKCFPCFHS